MGDLLRNLRIKLWKNRAPSSTKYRLSTGFGQRLIEGMPLDIIANVAWHEITDRFTRGELVANEGGGDRKDGGADKVDGVTAWMHVRIITTNVTKAF